MLIKKTRKIRLKKRNLPKQTASYVGNVDYITPDFVCDDPDNFVIEKEPVAEVEQKKRLRDKVKELHEKLSHKDDEE